MPTATILAWLINVFYIYMKTWSQSCHSFHAVNALASPKLSKRATLKAPRLCTYIESTLENERQNHSKPIRAVYNTPHEAFPLLCSWQLCSNCQIITASKPKRTVTPYMYICLPNLCPLGLPVWVRRYKDNTFTLKTTLFGWQSMIPRSDLTLLNINISKNSV